MNIAAKKMPPKGKRACFIARSRCFLPKFLVIMAATLALAISPARHSGGDWNPDPLGIYPTAWGEVAQEKGVDPYILYSIALIESRRSYSDGLVRPWLFAIGSNIPPKAYYPNTQQEAKSLLLKLLKNSNNVDIGMLQINLIHHGHRVKTPFELLDYRKNIEVGAQILREAMDSAPQDPELGVGRYHSWTNKLSRPYGNKVLRLAYALKSFDRRKQ